MTSPDTLAPSLPSLEDGRTAKSFLGVPALLGAGAILGAGVAVGLAIPLAALLLVGVATYVGLRHWRWSIYGLLAYFPFSGIPFVLLYPNTAPAGLLKDFLFVLPAYAGFFGTAIVKRQRITYPGLPLVTGGLFAAMVCVQAFNPSVPSPLAAAVGVKVWLLYMPMMVLGYHLVDNRRDLGRLLGLLSVTAIIPAAIGIVEAGLIYSGQAATVNAFYGDAAATVTQGFGVLSVGGADIQRVASTFPFAAQYLVFLTVMVAVTLAWWRGGFERIQGGDTAVAQKGLAALLCLLMVVAAFLSGSRGAFVLVPLILVLALVLERRRGIGRGFAVVGVVAAMLVAISVFGASSSGFVKSLSQHTSDQFSLIFTSGVEESLQTTTTGLGTGSDTNAARYVLSDPSTTLTTVGGVRQESWYVKALVELGVLGLILLVTLLCVVFWGALRGHFQIRDSGLRSVSAALLALLVVHVLYNVKGQYPDIDPLNVYLWLFLGLLARVAALDRTRSPV